MNNTERMPVLFIPHGGGPWPFVDLGFPREEVDRLAGYLRTLPQVTKTRPKALLVISAHWEEPVPTVMSAERPPLLYDYYGFPPEAYAITWPAPGEPAVAARVLSLLRAAGIEGASNGERGFDHGTFIPFKVAYPDADIPTVQLSLRSDLGPAEHLALGRAIAPLRDEGIFIVGSGMSFHNMRGFRDPRSGPLSQSFDDWLSETVALPSDERDRRLAHWEEAPQARYVHPREEHLLPLMVAAGAAGDDRGTVPYRGTFMGTHISAVAFGG
jgi:aromatic ring-opening dioxygenase catalytic subunit (LigB family)